MEQSMIEMDRLILENPSEDEWLAARKKHLTSTDVSVLFGASKYKSTYQVWSEKSTGIVAPFKDNDRMKWGRRLEWVVAQGLAEDAGLGCTPYKDYVWSEKHRIGSSFDALTSDGALLEIKTVDPMVFKNQWFKMPGGDYVAPEHIELQVQHQMLVSGIDVAYIGVLVGGNNGIPLQRRVADETIQQQILERAAEFWKSVDESSAPPVDFDSELDVRAVIAAHAHSEPGTETDACEEANGLAQRYIDLRDEIKGLTKDQDSIKAQILELVGDTERVRGDGWSLNAGLQGPVEVPASTRKGYRRFKITKKRSKDNG